jgi:hypothetical protein
MLSLAEAMNNDENPLWANRIIIEAEETAAMAIVNPNMGLR